MLLYLYRLSHAHLPHATRIHPQQPQLLNPLLCYFLCTMCVPVCSMAAADTGSDIKRTTDSPISWVAPWVFSPQLPQFSVKTQLRSNIISLYPIKLHNIHRIKKKQNIWMCFSHWCINSSRYPVTIQGTVSFKTSEHENMNGTKIMHWYCFKVIYSFFRANGSNSVQIVFH